MMKRILCLLLFMASHLAWGDVRYRGLQVEVIRDGPLYTFSASFATPLTTCAAYHFLTDYEGARHLPGVVESLAYRQTANTVRVERTADERILFFNVRLHSVLEYTERPYDRITFTQLAGDSKAFQGQWDIEPNDQGSTLRFKGSWEPDTLIPLFIVDHFAKNGLIDKFSAIAKFAEKRKDTLPTRCAG